METPKKPENEDQRLAALKDIDLLDTTLDPAFERITRLAKRMLDVPIIAFSLIDSERQWFKSVQGLNSCETSRDVSFCGHTILQDEVLCVTDTLEDKRFHDNPLVTGEPHIRFYAGYPVRNQDGYKIGSLCIIDTKPRVLTSEELDLLKDMEALIEQQVCLQQQRAAESKLKKELAQAQRDTLIDPLTRIWNRKGIEEVYKSYLSAIDRGETEVFALVMIDIDNFKQINDNFGHLAGDHILREFTKAIITSIQQEHTLVRWGGEEFILFITASKPEINIYKNLIERVRTNIALNPIKFENHEIPITASFGITVISDSKIKLEDAVSIADEALYAAKNTGKNKCVIK